MKDLSFSPVFAGRSSRFFRRATVFLAATLLATAFISRDFALGKEPAPKSGWDDQFLNARREALLDEFEAFREENGLERPFKVKTSERFIFVYDVSDAYVEWLSALTNEVAKAFDKFCAKLELETEEPSEPLAVVVFATRDGFDAYAATLRGDRPWGDGNKPVGFFDHGSNRSFVFDMTDVEASRVANADGVATRQGVDFSWRKLNAEARSIKSRDGSGNNTSTIVHEISHQLAYNYGVFSLYQRQPDWVVEGMATTFEPTNDDAPLGWRFRNVFPVNEARLRDFVTAANDDANISILDEVVSSDRFEDELSVAGYGASWALFYYCYRKKTQELKRYIELLKKRPPRKVYSEDERMEEFQQCFGDLDAFKKQFVRFVRELNVKRIKTSDR